MESTVDEGTAGGGGGHRAGRLAVMVATERDGWRRWWPQSGTAGGGGGEEIVSLPSPSESASLALH